MKTHRFRFPITCPLAAALCLALVGCSGQAPSAGASPSTTAVAAPSPAAEQPAGVSAIDLRKRVQLALRKQRVFAPAGENAIELYVALRGRSAKPDADAQGALMELQPYAVIGAEQALARGNFAEAERLRGLIAAIDPDAPSLGRIAAAIKAKVGAQTQEAPEQSAATKREARTASAPTSQMPAPVASQATSRAVASMQAPEM